MRPKLSLLTLRPAVVQAGSFFFFLLPAASPSLPAPLEQVPRGRKQSWTVQETTSASDVAGKRLEARLGNGESCEFHATADRVVE